MNLKLILPAVLSVIAGNLFAQSVPKSPFIDFANKQTDLMHDAYTKRDIATDKKLVAELTDKYNKLSSAEKDLCKGFTAGAYYNLSCLYSLENEKPEAFRYLDSAINNGYLDYSHIMEDTDFANIKDAPEFKRLANGIRAVSDYVYILKKGEKYNPADVRKFPAFTYQSADAPDLVALKKKYNLDVVAGNGDETSKAINLLHWVHNMVNHDGQHESGIEYINADVIITTAQAKKIGVSCGELASVLNDCYLAMGWKSRKVYCFPKDSLKMDYDSHVINVVYLPSLHKWVWMDPTNDAYVSDENHHLLSIREVRERIITGKPLEINADANWNHRENVVKQNYLYSYMAKNLYLVYSPLRSEYDYQTPAKNKMMVYIQLLPLDYFKQAPDKSENTNQETKVTVVRYKTNNPDLFWQAPAGL